MVRLSLPAAPQKPILASPDRGWMWSWLNGSRFPTTRAAHPSPRVSQASSDRIDRPGRVSVRGQTVPDLNKGHLVIDIVCLRPCDLFLAHRDMVPRCGRGVGSLDEYSYDVTRVVDWTGRMYQRIRKNLESQGFTVKSENRHVVMISPDGDRVTIPKTMGEGRALKNLRSQIRRLGYDLTRGRVGGRGGYP